MSAAVEKKSKLEVDAHADEHYSLARSHQSSL